MNRGKKQQEKP